MQVESRRFDLGEKYVKIHDARIIYQFDIENERLHAYILEEPYLEIESIDFANGKVCVLMNGTGLTRGRYYIYEAKFDKSDID